MKYDNNIKESKFTTGAGLAVLVIAVLNAFGIDLQKFGINIESLTMLISAIILLFAKDPNNKSK
jgi:hypothetical protein